MILMVQTCVTIGDPDDLRSRLLSLDLTPELLLDVVKHYAQTVLGMSEDHPSWCTGITPAGEAVFALRQLTRPRGWSREEVRGFALTIHPKGLLAVNVAKGDINTGNPAVQPTSHSEKGICTVEALAENQLAFDFVDARVTAETPPVRPTWYLLVRVGDGVVKSEFSLPIAMSPDKHISKWAERLIFKDLRIRDLALETPTEPDTPKITPIVTRKNGK